MADPKTRVRLIIPTAINVVTMANEAILKNFRQGTDGIITLPSLRTRARMIVDEAGLLSVKETLEETPLYFTR